MAERHARFNGLFNVLAIQNAKVHIVGCGSVGASLAHLLARVDVGTLHLWDPDTIAPHNLGVQPFFEVDVGCPKVVALAMDCGHYNHLVTTCEHAYRFTPEEADLKDCTAIFSCVDNMSTRRLLFDTAVAHKIPFFDARVAGHTVETYYWLPGTSPAAYEATLFPDSQMLEMPCGTKMTPHAPAVAASILYSLFAAYVSGNPLPRSGASLDLSILTFVD